MKRRWLLVAAVMGLVPVVPPVTLWYYDGPRSGRTADGLYSVFVRHDGEVALELSRKAPDVEPTREEVRAAAQLLEESSTNAVRFKDFSWATTSGGYTVSNVALLDRPESRFYHVWNPEYLRDGRTLDPTAPEALVYFNPGDDQPKQLVGIMYTAPPGRHGEQPGGNLTRWHLHQVVEFCQDSDGVPRVAAERGTRGGCPEGMNNGPTPEMMHVWLVDNPRGAFSHQMALPGEATAGHHAPENVYAAFLRRGSLFLAARLGLGRAPHAPTATKHADVAPAERDEHASHDEHDEHAAPGGTLPADSGTSDGVALGATLTGPAAAASP